MWNFTANATTPTYDLVKEINTAALSWGAVITRSTHRGVLFTPAASDVTEWTSVNPGKAGGVPPSPASIITSMSSEALVGVFRGTTESPDDTTAHLIIVDTRVGNLTSVPHTQPRELTLTLHPAVAAVVRVQPHKGETVMRPVAGGGTQVKISLRGGEGTMLRVSARHGHEMEFIGSTRFRPWQFDREHAAATKHQSWGGQTTNTDLHATSQYGPTALTSFMFGCTHESQPLQDSEADIKKLSEAGFNWLSLPASTPHLPAFGAALEHARLHGMLISGHTTDPIALRPFACSPNLAGWSADADPSSYATIMNAAMMLRDNNGHLLPLVRSRDVKVAIALGSHAVGSSDSNFSAVPVASAVVPPAMGQVDALTAGKATLQVYGQLRDAARGVTTGVGFSFIASIDSCTNQSDSMMRFMTYSSMLFGVQGIFHQNVEACMAEQWRFMVLSGINQRLQQWVEVFTSYQLTTVYMPTSWGVSDCPFDSCSVPGQSGENLIKSASEDLLIAVMEPTSAPDDERWPSPSSKSQLQTVLFVVSTRLQHTPGAESNRPVSIVLHPRVVGTQAIENSCRAGFTQCNKLRTGSTAELQLPGGSAQLVALAIVNATSSPIAERDRWPSDVRAPRARWFTSRAAGP